MLSLMQLIPFVALAFIIVTVPASAAEIILESPDEQNKILLRTATSNQPNTPLSFEIKRRDQSFIQGTLGLQLQGLGDVFRHATLVSKTQTEIDETYSQPGHKSNPVRNHCRQLAVRLKSPSSLESLTLELRAHNDGVAFRYVIPTQSGLESVAVTEEHTRFQPIGKPRLWPLYLDHFQTPHEDDYDQTTWPDLQTERLIGLPLLMQFSKGSVAFMEAGLSNYAGLYLTGQHRGSLQNKTLELKSALSPMPLAGLIKARGSLPFASPWRVFMLADQPGPMLESSLVLNLNAPSAIEDTSWLRFGKTTWNWWNGFYQQPVDFTTGANFETIRHYIDFCASNNIAFHAIDCADANTSWYLQDSPGFAPGPGADITTPRPELQFERALRYAKEKGVGVRLWVHSTLLAERLEEAFAQYEAWGIEGLMVDFLDRDDQLMVLWSEHVLQTAARHRLRIQFHGVWEPTGRRRTYPNLVNHEAVLNLEYLKWSNRCDPEHNLITPYTRMLAGPMDYHSGGFQAVPRDQFKFRNIQPQVLGTRCHHLAMYVVHENPVPMIADGPSAYAGQPGFEFLRQVPTTWDETRFLAGAVGDSIAVARRHGQDWYLGAMSDWSPRQLTVPLDFLGDQSYVATIWSDAKNNPDPNQLQKSTRTVSGTDQLAIDMASGGGQVIHLTPTSP